MSYFLRGGYPERRNRPQHLWTFTLFNSIQANLRELWGRCHCRAGLYHHSMPLTRGRQKQRDDIYEAFIALSAAGEALILCFMCSNKAAEFTGNKYSILQPLRTRRINTVHNSLMSGLITAVVMEKRSWGKRRDRADTWTPSRAERRSVGWYIIFLWCTGKGIKKYNNIDDSGVWAPAQISPHISNQFSCRAKPRLSSQSDSSCLSTAHVWLADTSNIDKPVYEGDVVRSHNNQNSSAKRMGIIQLQTSYICH